MKNKKLILIIVILIIGIFLVSYGVFNYLDKNISTPKEQDNTGTISVEEKTKEENFEEENIEEVESGEKELKVTDFSYEKKEDGNIDFKFTLINNTDKEITNEVLKIYFYNQNKELLNTFEYETEDLGIYDEMEIESSISIENGEVSIFEYEFHDVKKELTVSK